MSSMVFQRTQRKNLQNVRNLLPDVFNGVISPGFFSGDLLFVSNEDD